MKKNCLFLFFALGIGHTYAQNGGNTTINPAETFAKRKGTLLEKRYDEVGKVGFLNIQVEYIKDISTADKLECIRFDIQLANSPTRYG